MSRMLGLAAGKVERVTISKHKLFMPRNERVLVEARCAVEKRDGGVAHDLDGKVVDIVKP
jgi:hypothetical protein